MSLRDLVTGSDNCTPGDGAGPSNAFAGLANTVLGTSSKDQERLREVPGFHGLPGTSEARYVPQRPEDAAQALAQGPGAFPGMLDRPFDNVEEFLQGASSSHAQGPTADWHNEFEDFHPDAGRMHIPPGTAALQSSFLGFLRGDLGYPRILPATEVDFSVEQQCKIRDRSLIMARHIFQEGDGLQADVQVEKLMHALRIDSEALPGSVDPQADWGAIYANGQTHGDAGLRHDTVARRYLLNGQRPYVDRWADEFADLNFAPQDLAEEDLLNRNMGDAMAREFLEQKFNGEGAQSWEQEFNAGGEQGWANEFDQIQANAEARSQARAGADQDSLEQTRALAATMASSSDPKFKQSKFLQFVSKMSRGEIILEDNQAKEVLKGANDWAQEFHNQQDGSSWANDFHNANLEDAWQETQQPGWADEFQREQHPPNAWADQFAAGEWAEEFLDQHHPTGLSDSTEYQFAPNNPFMQDLESFKKGKELFRNGLLSEARLAFEAEVQRNPGNVDAWRLLGTVHAENDNDLQAIAALHKALAAEPTNSEVLLSLGVSYTNELDQRHALEYLMSWLKTVPGQEGAASVQLPSNAREMLRVVIDIFKSATRMNPASADAHVALGVLLNLARDFDGAVGAFRTALQTRTTDYSLWNKLGATLANSARSGESIEAYQKALELKPNYMRAWVNMGIAQANLAEYDTSARFYVRALSMNPQASSVWGYLRNVLVCSGRSDLLQAVEDEDVTSLNQALPLE